MQSSTPPLPSPSLSTAGLSTGSLLRFDLGGIGQNGPRTTVNLAGGPDLHHDFTDLDAFCQDDSVDEFFMSHALEHVPADCYEAFLRGLLKKLKPGGAVRVIQTDIKAALQLYASGALSFRAVRTVIHTPAERVRQNPLHQHHNMWGVQELMEDFRAVGFAPAESFDGGTWWFDMKDDLFPGELEKFWGVPIPNLGVSASKPF
jgi:hypothetical protein